MTDQPTQIEARRSSAQAPSQADFATPQPTLAMIEARIMGLEERLDQIHAKLNTLLAHLGAPGGKRKK